MVKNTVVPARISLFARHALGLQAEQFFEHPQSPTNDQDHKRKGRRHCLRPSNSPRTWPFCAVTFFYGLG